MNDQLRALHALCLGIQRNEFKERLTTLAEYFLGCKYGAWKTGSTLETLDDFNYDLNTLDCVTYVEVVLALLTIKPHRDYKKFVTSFEDMLRQIHYANGVPSFLTSNHFMCVDWITNNKFIVEDITNSLADSAQIAEAAIDKLSWFKRHKINQDSNIDFPQHVIKQLSTQISRVPYITTEELLNNYSSFVQKFPEFCIVNIVRPNWDLTEKIGTHLNISHLGFAIKQHTTNELKFLHATSELQKVVQETLAVYMQRQQARPTIRGINVLAISPGFYHAG